MSRGFQKQGAWNPVAVPWLAWSSLTVLCNFDEKRRNQIFPPLGYLCRPGGTCPAKWAPIRVLTGTQDEATGSGPQEANGTMTGLHSGVSKRLADATGDDGQRKTPLDSPMEPPNDTLTDVCPSTLVFLRKARDICVESVGRPVPPPP